MWFLCVVDSRSIPRPTPLGQLHDHGSQLWWVSANGSISDGWSNRADTQHQMAAINFGGHRTLVNQAWLGARALTVVGQCSSNSMVLKRTGYVRKSCSCIYNPIWSYSNINTWKRSLYLLFTWFRICITSWWHPFIWCLKSFFQVLCKEKIMSNSQRNTVQIRGVNLILAWGQS